MDTIKQFVLKDKLENANELLADVNITKELKEKIKKKLLHQYEKETIQKGIQHKSMALEHQLNNVFFLVFSIGEHVVAITKKEAFEEFSVYHQNQKEMVVYKLEMLLEKEKEEILKNFRKKL